MSNNIWFSSDHHFWHNKIQQFCPTSRHGDGVDEMNEAMIQIHNNLVAPGDEVWFLGDFSFGTAQQTESILKRLNGKLNLVYGNHDKVIKNNTHLQQYFTSIHEYKVININKTKFVLFHFPIMEHESCHHGSIHCYGHVHGKFNSHPHGKSMDVGIDARPDNDMAPFHVDEIFRIMKDRHIVEHHNVTRN